MRQVILLLLLAVVGWFGYAKYQARLQPVRAAELESEPREEARRDATSLPGFKCDGRVYCSQMTSCAEATFFLRNCPSVKMDGDGNGIPCEKQWCIK